MEQEFTGCHYPDCGVSGSETEGVGNSPML